MFLFTLYKKNKDIRTSRKKGFTLIELILAMLAFSLLMVVILGIYIGIIKLKYSLQAKTNLIETNHAVFTKLNLLIKDYTLDYEEYFNRSRVGCSSFMSTGFLWNVGSGGACTLFTAYGNENTLSPDIGSHELYYCSSVTGYVSTDTVLLSAAVQNGSGCFFSSGKQSFGQYRLQFVDVKDDVDATPGAVNDSDDQNIGLGPDAIVSSTGVQELYLISQDGTKRVLLRRKLMGSGDWNGDGVISGSTEFWYSLQILKLRGFDAGNHHDFSVTNSSGVYNGTIDTWACDYSQGFVCAGSGIGNLYSGYRLPLDQNDGWVDLFDKNMTISSWNLSLYPTKNPDLAWADDLMQINPYIVLSLQSKLYGEIWQKRLQETMNDFSFDLQTMFDIKTFYAK